MRFSDVGRARVFAYWFVPLALFLGWGMYALSEDRPALLGWNLIGPHQFLSMPGLIFEELRSNSFAHGARMPGYFFVVVLVSAVWWALLGGMISLGIQRWFRAITRKSRGG